MKINWLYLVLLGALAAPAGAADGMSGATVKPDARGASERRSPHPRCEGDREQCMAERKARREKFCAENPEKCKAMRANMEERRAQCKENPEKCREERQARFQQRFKAADADGNGRLSRAEAEKGMPGLARRFDRIDANNDGQLSRDEIQAAFKSRKGAGKGEGRGKASQSAP